MPFAGGVIVAAAPVVPAVGPPAGGAVAADLVKRAWTACLVGAASAPDPWLAAEVRRAVEFALTGDIAGDAPIEAYAETALELFQKWQRRHPGCGFRLVDWRGRPYDPLWLRTETVQALRALAGYPRALLAVVGLREAISAGGRRWGRAQQARLDEAAGWLDALAARYAGPRSALTLVCA